MSCDISDFWTPLVTLRPLVGAMPRCSIGNIEAKWSKNGSGKSWPKNGQKSTQGTCDASTVIVSPQSRVNDVQMRSGCSRGQNKKIDFLTIFGLDMVQNGLQMAPFAGFFGSTHFF
jgi:hypothetical protein